MYRMDARYERDPYPVRQTSDFYLPMKRRRDKTYKIPAGSEVFTCGTSDFFIEEADEWRKEAWRQIRDRSDLSFLIITKRIHRFAVSLPEDWGEGYAHVAIGCTVENQEMADYRLPLFLDAPIRHRIIVSEPLLEAIDLSAYLDRDRIDEAVAGGESGNEARVCDYDWIVSIQQQCIKSDVPFWFKQTGAFFRKDGKLYRIPRKLQHEQAKKSGLSTI
jgi:protein gp37